MIAKNDIESAIANGEFKMHYQPRVNFQTGRISGGEALIRWLHPQKGFISPELFIPRAEELGLINQITAHIIPMVINDIIKLKASGFSGSISINASPLDFETDIIIGLLDDILSRKIILPSDLQIELTETAKLENDAKIIDRLRQITEFGIHLSMDDFGTGYASIDLLSQLPFSAMKIDKGVVQRMANSPKSLNIVNMIINMARTLRMQIVAEGIEDHHTYRFLAYAGCYEAQGYWLSKPLPFEDFAKLIAKAPEWPSTQIGMLYHAHMNNVYFKKSILDAVLYYKSGIRDKMPAVTKPDVQFAPEKTRMGNWYYGAGKALSHLESYRAIESPHRTKHEVGHRLFNLATHSINHLDIEQLIKEFNFAFEQVNQSLHMLEIELIAAENSDKWRLSN